MCQGCYLVAFQSYFIQQHLACNLLIIATLKKKKIKHTLSDNYSEDENNQKSQKEKDLSSTFHPEHQDKEHRNAGETHQTFSWWDNQHN